MAVVLGEHPGVVEAAVVVRSLPDGTPALAGFAVPAAPAVSGAVTVADLQPASRRAAGRPGRPDVAGAGGRAAAHPARQARRGRPAQARTCWLPIAVRRARDRTVCAVHGAAGCGGGRAAGRRGRRLLRPRRAFAGRPAVAGPASHRIRRRAERPRSVRRAHPGGPGLAALTGGGATGGGAPVRAASVPFPGWGRRADPRHRERPLAPAGGREAGRVAGAGRGLWDRAPPGRGGAALPLCLVPGRRPVRAVPRSGAGTGRAARCEQRGVPARRGARLRTGGRVRPGDQHGGGAPPRRPHAARCGGSRPCSPRTACCSCGSTTPTASTTGC